MVKKEFNLRKCKDPCNQIANRELPATTPKTMSFSEFRVFKLSSSVLNTTGLLFRRKKNDVPVRRAIYGPDTQSWQGPTKVHLAGPRESVGHSIGLSLLGKLVRYNFFLLIYYLYSEMNNKIYHELSLWIFSPSILKLNIMKMTNFY